VNRFTRQTLPTVNSIYFLVNIFYIESFCPQKTPVEIWSSEVHSSSTVAILTTETSLWTCACVSAAKAVLCCYLVTHIHRNPITSITAVILQFVSYLLTPPRNLAHPVQSNPPLHEAQIKHFGFLKTPSTFKILIHGIKYRSQNTQFLFEIFLIGWIVKEIPAKISYESSYFKICSILSFHESITITNSMILWNSIWRMYYWRCFPSPSWQ
jgi:hypothetical protein